jgi:hypothetical protein
MGQGRFSALARLGLAKSRARLGRDRSETAAELADLARALDRLGLRHAREMVSRAQEGARHLGGVPDAAVRRAGGERTVTALTTALAAPEVLDRCRALVRPAPEDCGSQTYQDQQQ